MIKRFVFICLAAVATCQAAPLDFFIVPGSGIAPHTNPMVMPDVQAIAAAEQKMLQEKKRYEQGLSDVVGYLDAQLDYLHMLTPLLYGEKSQLMHKGRLFKAARDKRKVVEARHKLGAAGDNELYIAQLEDAWLRARQIRSADADVCQDQMKRAENMLAKLEGLVDAGVKSGVADKAEQLLVAAAAGELKLAQSSWFARGCDELLSALQGTYDQLAELMTAREREGLCEPDAAASAREAARIFRREVVLRKGTVTPELVAALQERCEIIAAMEPVLQQIARKERWTIWDARHAAWRLEREQMKLQSARNQLRKP